MATNHPIDPSIFSLSSRNNLKLTFSVESVNEQHEFIPMLAVTDPLSA